MNGVPKDGLHFRLTVGRKRLMAGTKIKDLAITPSPATAGPENFTALEPGNKHRFFRSGNSEGFAVHFFVRNFEVGLDSLSDRVARIAYPKPFFFAGFAPDKGAGGAHQ